ncbi:MAG TPA: hypothetical protein VLM83_00675 [Anaerolineales bacterium]|nr:hypothetical protein [Anaerolineales bacterium]
MNKRLIAMIVIFTLVLVLMACEMVTPPRPGTPLVGQTFISGPYDQEAAYAAAQATLVSGENEIMELSRQATIASLNMDQAANVAAQATLDTYLRQLLELSIRGTEISQEMAWAAATQQFIVEQTQLAWNAITTAQSQAATATYSTYILNVTQTAQVQAILDLQTTHTAQAYATQTAYSLTATPFAALQAEIVRARNESDRRALWGEFVVTPLTVILITLVIVLLIMGGVLAYRRFMPVLELRLRTIITRSNESPMLLVDGMIVDPDPLHHQLGQQELILLNPAQLPSDDTPPVEIIGPSEPSITNWITEAEQELRSEGWISV